VTNRFAAFQRHVLSAVAALALSTFVIGAAIAPVSVEAGAPTEQQQPQA
jgi:hypothetical protein